MTEIMDIPEDDLPLWMKQARRTVDWGVLVVMFFSLLMAWSFFMQDGLPHNNSTENYVYMAYNYGESFREGVLYPRWSAPAVFGYGAPIPNYYPPGAPYSVALLDLLFLDNTLLATRMVYALSLMMAGVMTYVFVMRWAGAGAGVIAALLYVYSPYLGFVAPHIIGDLPDMIALALLPAALWALNRILLLNHSSDALLLAIITAFLILTDLLIAGFTLLLGLILLLTQSSSRGRIVLVIFAVLVGIGMASVYWLPAWLEQDLVRWQSPVFEPLPHHISIPGLLRPLHMIDLNAQVNHPQFTLGLMGVGFGIAGIYAVYRLRLKQQGIFLLVGILTLIACIITQQSWLMGAAVFCLSVGSSAVLNLRDLLPVSRRRLMLPLLLMIILVLSFPAWLSPRWAADFGGTDAAAQINYESQGLGVASLPPSVDLPLTLVDPITPNLTLITGYQSGEVIRIPPTRLTGERQANLLFSRSQSDRYQVSTRGATSFDVLRAYAPGWKATLDERPVSLDPDPATGLMRVTIPDASQNRALEIYYGQTEAQEWAWMLTVGSLVLIGIFAGIRLLRDESRVFYDNVRLLLVEDARLLGVICAGFGVILLLFVAPSAPYTFYPRSGSGLDGFVELRARTDVGVEVLAYQIDSGTHYSVGDNVDVSLAWRTSRRLLENYAVQVYLVNAESPESSPRWRITPPQHPGGYATRRWVTGQYVLDPHAISTATIPPGEYQVAVIMTFCNPVCPPESLVNFFDSGGQLIGQQLILPTRLVIE